MRENVRNMSRGRAGRERWEFALDNRQIAAVAVGALVIVGSSFVLGMNAGRSMARQPPKAAVANSLDAFDTAHENLPTPPEPKNWEYEKLGGARAPDATPSSANAQARVPPTARPLAPRPAQDAGASAETSKASITAAVAAANAPAPASTAAPPPEHPKPSPAPAGAPVAAAPVNPVAAAPVKPNAAAPVKPNAAPAAAATATKAAAPERSAMDKAIAAVSGTAPHGGQAAAGPSTTIAKPSAKSASGAFVIQVGASPNKTEADRIAKRFAARGARVVAADVDGKRWYRVRLASTTYGDRSEAERALSRLSRETGVRGFVTAAQ